MLLIILVAVASLHAVYATILDENNQDEALNHREDRHEYPYFLRSSGVYPQHRLLREGKSVFDRIRRDGKRMKNAEEGGDIAGGGMKVGEEGGEGGHNMKIQNQLETQQMTDRYSRYDMFELEDATTSNTWVGPQSGTSGINWLSITSDSKGMNLAAGTYFYGILLSIYLFIVICVYFLNPCYYFITII